MAALAPGVAVKGLESRARRAAERAAEGVKERVVSELDAPGVNARITSRGVELSGRGLTRRLLIDPRLRWVGGLFR